MLGSLVLTGVWLARPVLGIDTLPLLRGTDTLATCLGELDLVDCAVTPPMDPYPVLQHVPDLVAHSFLGLGDGGRVRVLAWLGVIAIVVSVAAAWRVLARYDLSEWRWLFLLVVASGPVIAYGNTAWGEMLASGLVTLLVATALLQSQPALVGLAAFGAGITKETGYPFVIALGLLGLVLARRGSGRSIRPQLVGGGLGVAAGVAVATLLNLLRFGELQNTVYLRDELRTPSTDLVLELGAGLLVSPSGGILVFWPLASLLVVVLLVLPLQRGARARRAGRDAWLRLRSGSA